MAKAAKEVDAAILAALEDLPDPEYEFSQEFFRKMHELCPSIDPETGEVRRSE